MKLFAYILGTVLIVIVLADAFETVVFPRRVTRRVRLVRIFYRLTWPIWSRLANVFSSAKAQETFLSYYGPLSLPALLCFWAVVLIFGYALLYWAPGDAIKTPDHVITFGACLYFSGTTFFTLGLGDISPNTALTRVLIVFQAGMGFAFLAIVISYLPALNQSFARREVNISLLDARAGSPPSALEILRRHSQDHTIGALAGLLYDWERWSAELLESHLSFPVLVYFRSQHDNQSWLAALTSILDTSAFVITNLEGESVRQAQLTFAMARHAIVDLALVLHTPPQEPLIDRLPQEDFEILRQFLNREALHLRAGKDPAQRLAELRRMYKPYVYALSHRLRLALPHWIPEMSRTDNWQMSAWGRTVGFRQRPSHEERRDRGHF
jgi:Ion channel